MKALYARGPLQFGMEERPLPVPGDDEILIKVHSVAICHTDLMLRDGSAGHAKYPFIPGHEFAGEIVAQGKNAQHYPIGTRGVVRQIITCGTCRACQSEGPVVRCLNMREMGCDLDGGMAEYCVLPEANFLPIPDSLSFDEAALCEPVANACCAVGTAQIQPNDVVVVIGPGPIGIAAAKLAKLRGAGKVILTGTRDSRLSFAMAHDFGVDEVVNIRSEGAEEDLLNRILAGRGADVVLETSGTLSGLEMSFRAAARGARILAEGLPPRSQTMPFNTFLLPDCASFHRISAWSRLDFVNALAFIASGKIDASAMITHRFSFREWEAAFETVATRKDEAIKVILKGDVWE